MLVLADCSWRWEQSGGQSGTFHAGHGVPLSEESRETILQLRQQHHSGQQPLLPLVKYFSPPPPPPPPFPPLPPLPPPGILPNSSRFFKMSVLGISPVRGIHGRVPFIYIFFIFCCWSDSRHRSASTASNRRNANQKKHKKNGIAAHLAAAIGNTRQKKNQPTEINQPNNNCITQMNHNPNNPNNTNSINNRQLSCGGLKQNNKNRNIRRRRRRRRRRWIIIRIWCWWWWWWWW